MIVLWCPPKGLIGLKRGFEETCAIARVEVGSRCIPAETVLLAFSTREAGQPDFLVGLACRRERKVVFCDTGKPSIALLVR